MPVLFLYFSTINAAKDNNYSHIAYEINSAN